MKYKHGRQSNKCVSMEAAYRNHADIFVANLRCFWCNYNIYCFSMACIYWPIVMSSLPANIILYRALSIYVDDVKSRTFTWLDSIVYIINLISLVYRWYILAVARLPPLLQCARLIRKCFCSRYGLTEASVWFQMIARRRNRLVWFINYRRSIAITSVTARNFYRDCVLICSTTIKRAGASNSYGAQTK